MTRSRPFICFDSFESVSGLEDQYVSSWLKMLESNFSIFFCNQSLPPSSLHRVNLFKTKRIFADFERQKNIIAAFCFNRGLMCDKSFCMSLKKKGIKTISVVYGQRIFDEMADSIQIGLFDHVVLSRFSSLKDEVLSLNPIQSFSFIDDGFPLETGQAKSGFGVLCSSGEFEDIVFNTQIRSMKRVLGGCEPFDIRSVYAHDFQKGYILLPQHASREDFVKKARSIYCSGLDVFVPKETASLFYFGFPYGSMHEIKDMTINKYLDNTDCFDSYDFNSSVMSIINRS